MKLPEIDFNAPINDSSRSAMAVSEAQGNSIKKIANAALTFRDEFARAQRKEAEVKVKQSMADIQTEINANKQVSTEWVRQKLGGSLDSLPPEVRAQVVNQGIDINSGQPTEFDREDVPTFAVAAHIFDVQANRAVEAASQGITIGDKEDFKNQMQGEYVIPHKFKINMDALHEGIAYVAEKDTKSVLGLAAAGDFEGARDLAAKSRAFEPAYREKLLGHVDKIEQTKPIYDAIKTENIGEMVKLLRDLTGESTPETGLNINTGETGGKNSFSTLEPQEKAAFAERLRAEIKQFEGTVKNARTDALKLAAEAGWNGIFEKQRQGVPVSYRDVPPPGSIPADEQKQMIAYVDHLREGKPVKTDFAVYAFLRDKVKNGEPVNLMKYRMSLSDGDLKGLIDAQEGKGKPVYDNFINTEEAINAKLAAPYDLGGYKIDLKSAKDDPEMLAKIGQVKSIVQTELANLGRPPTLAERDEIIDRVLKQEISVKKNWLFADEKKVSSLGIPPRYVSAWRRVASDLGIPLTAEGLQATHKDFSYYEPGITRAWAPLAGSKRPLTPDKAVGIYGLLKSRWGIIDSELARQGLLTGKNEVDNPRRAALATEWFLRESP